MSRLSYNEGEDVNALLAMGRWQRNSVTTLKSKRGQQMLRDLEAALLALPEKRLLRETFYEADTGAVCAVGAYARFKGCDPSVLDALADEGGDDQAQFVADTYGQAFTLIWNIIELNDDGAPWPIPGRHETEEERYERVLRWVQDRREASP